MPNVPLPSGTLSTSEAPLAQADAPAQSFGATVAANAAGDLGQAFAHVSDDQQKSATLIQGMANKADANTALSGFLNDSLAAQNKYTSLQGKAAVDAYPDVVKQINDLHNQYASTLSSPAAQLEFETYARRQLSFTLADVSRQAAAQTKAYHNQSNLAQQETGTNVMISNYNNPDQFNRGLAQVVAAQDQLDAANGADSDTHNNNVLNAGSKAISLAVKAVGEGDPMAASNLYEQYKSHLSPLDAVTLGAYVKRAIEPEQNAAAASAAIAAAKGSTSTVPSLADADWFKQGIIPQEGFHGSPSSAGAQGPAQMMSATEAKYSNIPAPNGDNTNRGIAYFSDLKSQFGGNAIAATAAYNAGPEAVNDWINGTNHQLPDGKFTNPNHLTLGVPQPGQEAQWAAAIPYKETRGYVQGVLSKVGVGSTPGVDDYESAAVANAQAYAQKAFPNDPLRQEAIVSQTEHQVQLNRVAENAQYRSTSDSILSNMLPKPDGSVDAQTQQELFAIPGMQAAYNSLPAPLQRNIDKQLNANLNFANSHPTESQLTNFDQYYGMAKTNPQQFVNTSAKELLSSDMTVSQQQQLIKLQANLAGRPPPKNDSLQSALSYPTVKSFTDRVFGKVPDDDAGNAVRKQQFNQFAGALQGRLDAISAQNGGKPIQPEQAADAAHALLATYGPQKSGYAGNSKLTGAPGFAIPSNELDMISQSFQRPVSQGGYGRKPSSDEAARIYFRTHGANAGG